MYSNYIFENLKDFSYKSTDNLEIKLEYITYLININIYIDKLR
jgi:hypothetical protein